MLTADQIHDKLRGLDPQVALAVLAELSMDRVYEAERLILAALGSDRHDEAMEIVASIVRGTVRGTR